MKKESINLRDKDMNAKTFASESQLQNKISPNQLPDALQKYDQLSSETPLMKFLSCLLTGSKQDQIHALSTHYKQVCYRRKQMGIRSLSRTQFLEIVRHSLKQTGLVSDKYLRSIDLNMLPRNSCAILEPSSYHS